MTNHFASFEIAVTLKDLGFDEPCIAYYDLDGNFLILGQNDRYKWHTTFSTIFIIEAPIYPQIINWFREKHNLQTFLPFYQPQNRAYYNWTQFPEIIWEVEYETYEEAVLAHIKTMIEIVSKKM